MINYLFLLLISLPCFSMTKMELVPNAPSIKQGEIVQGKLIVRETQGQVLFKELEGKTVSKILYLLDISPFIQRQGQLEADAKVIFISVPDVSSVKEIIGNDEITISWSNISVQPVEASQTFLFGKFDIPLRKNFLTWFLLLCSLIAVAIITIKVIKIFKKKAEIKVRKAKLKQELLSCQSYNDIVFLWENKRVYFKEFPLIEEKFKKLEQILFKYQFKPARNEREEQEIISAYKDFKQEVSGDLNGI